MLVQESFEDVEGEVIRDVEEPSRGESVVNALHLFESVDIKLTNDETTEHEETGVGQLVVAVHDLVAMNQHFEHRSL